MNDQGCPPALRAASEHWTIHLEGEVHRSLSGWVALGVQSPVDRGRNPQPVAIKVAGPGSDEMLATRALEHFDGRGCVRLLDRWENVSLLERALPGTPASELSRAGRDDEAIHHIARVAMALHQAGTPPAAWGFPRVERWGEGFARYRAAGAQLIPPPLIQAASGLFGELARSQESTCLLHGDLHHFNLLLDTGRGWLAIDPKGVIGEPAYEFGACLRNPVGEGFAAADPISPQVIESRIRILADLTRLDGRRILAWAFAQAVLSAVWCWEDGEPVETAVAFAEALRQAWMR